MKTQFLSVFTLLLAISLPVHALKPMTDSEIKNMIVQGAVSSYKGECPCPYSVHNVGEENNRQKIQCGQDSAYFKDLTNKPKCYPEDIQPSDINHYRSEYNIPEKFVGQTQNPGF